MKAKAMLVGGTASHAGKSWMATAICRWLRRRGVRVAPFKAQNMSNNSYPCADGGEIGRAQVVQAEACGLEPSSLMNPILLKPTSNTGSQVVVRGKVWRNLSARAYYEHFDYLWAKVREAYEELAAGFDYIVAEGAGSITELNLKERDLVNLGFAARLQAPVLLVGDIDRGGIFASIAGTFQLLEESERPLVRSFAVNRFRGDPSLFRDGVRILERLTSRPCLGVFPMLENVPIDAEDGVSLERPPEAGGGQPAVAVLRFPRISNFTDFSLLAGLEWITRPVARRFEVVILPGTKSTLGDLAWMRERGLDEWVLAQHRAGALIVGVCGGYQMLGGRIDDPAGVESPETSAPGLGLLPVNTVMRAEKTARVVEARTPAGAAFRAYEIHMGETAAPPGARPFAILDGGSPEGIRTERCIGTYLHGAFENPAVARELLGRELCAAPAKERCYDLLADWFEQHADVPRFEEMYL